MIGVTVCVNYVHLLKYTLPYWMPGLNSCFVVTDLIDLDTVRLSQSHGCKSYKTDSFYAEGATFNKGRALSAVFDWARLRELDDWICLFDADIMPPPSWWHGMGKLQKGNLYTAPRWNADTIQDVVRPELTPIQEGPDGLCGYFLLFHMQDPNIPPYTEPMFSSWKHAGNYDTEFTMRWPRECYRHLPLRMIHIGTDRNWWGANNQDKQAMQKMYAERRVHGGDYEHERV